MQDRRPTAGKPPRRRGGRARSAEVGLFTPGATRERGKRLSTAYNLLYLESNTAMRERIQPHKVAWEGYFRDLMSSWPTAFFESGEVAAHEAEFARLRQESTAAGANVQHVPAISPPTPLLSPVQSAARELRQGATVLGIGAGFLGMYLLVRYLGRWKP